MPQFMQRAAWSRVSFSLRGTTNSLIVLDALGDRRVLAIVTFDFEKTCDLAH